MDRELARILNSGFDTTERIATALEKLVNEPMIDIQIPPPQCPHCGVIDPIVQPYPFTGGEAGHVAEYIVYASCTHCNKDLYGVVGEWSLQPDSQSALAKAKEISERN